MKKGIMLTNAVPSLEKNDGLLSYSLNLFKKHGMEVIEYYTKDGELAKEYGKEIKESGFVGIFHSAIDQKRSGWCRICSEDESLRNKSMDFTKRSVEKAIAAGANKDVIQSGRYPENPMDELVCLEALHKSIHELVAFVGNEISLGMEPCDRSVDVCQLIGPAMETYSFMDALKLKEFSLTMDTAHIALTYEDPYEAIKLCKPFCNHIHLANCSLRRESSLYGDKHPLFTNSDGWINDAEAAVLYEKLCKLYSEDDESIITVEMICREDNEIEYLDTMLNSMPWFFTTE
jgi:sugar phosphate isomerase/epimerase